MTIRDAESDDLDAVRALLGACGLPHEDITPGHLENFLVARDGDDLCGVAGLEPCGEAALLRSLAVVPALRDEGLGARLVNAIQRHARDEGIRTLYLLTTTAADYFETHGYERIDRDVLPVAIQQTEEAARLCPASATCMQKEFSTADDGRPTAE